jgi:hypothetical protein
MTGAFERLKRSRLLGHKTGAINILQGLKIVRIQWVIE